MISRVLARVPRPWLLGSVAALVVVAVVVSVVVSLSSDASPKAAAAAGSNRPANGSGLAGNNPGGSSALKTDDSGGPNPTNSDTLPNTIPEWSVTVAIQGTYVLTDSFSTRGSSDITGADTCADIAAHGTRVDTFTVPHLPTGGKMTAGHTLEGSISVLTYKGVGRYTDNDFAHTDNLIVDRQGSDMSTTRFLAPESGSPGTLTVNADGGGTFSFTDWQSPSSGGRISGSIVWTCQDTKL